MNVNGLYHGLAASLQPNLSHGARGGSFGSVQAKGRGAAQHGNDKRGGGSDLHGEGIQRLLG